MYNDQDEGRSVGWREPDQSITTKDWQVEDHVRGTYQHHQYHVLLHRFLLPVLHSVHRWQTDVYRWMDTLFLHTYTFFIKKKHQEILFLICDHLIIQNFVKLFIFVSFKLFLTLLITSVQKKIDEHSTLYGLLMNWFYFIFFKKETCLHYNTSKKLVIYVYL